MALLAAVPAIMQVVRAHIEDMVVTKACLSFLNNVSVNTDTLIPLMVVLPTLQAIGVRCVVAPVQAQA